MAFFDLPLEQLRTYKPERGEPRDFDAFWLDTLAETRRFPLNARFEPFDAGLRMVEVYDVTFAGYGGQSVKGWFILPAMHTGKLPCVVEFIGYGGGRGSPLNWLTFPAAGYATLVMDTRGQGSAWSAGDTPDPEPEGSNPFYPGFMTRGILDRQTYYYRRVFTDAVRAVETAMSHPLVDVGRLAVTGGSQGGGITLAAAGLVPEVSLALPDVPFLCHFSRAVTLVDTYPYHEIKQYVKVHRDRLERVFETLAYFDGMNFAARAHAGALFSVGLMDDICPPSTVYAAFNHYAGEKEMVVYDFNQHEGGGVFQTERKLRFLQNHWGAVS